MIATTPKRRIAPMVDQTIRYWGKSTGQPSRRRRRPIKNVKRYRNQSVPSEQRSHIEQAPTVAPKKLTFSGWQFAVICWATLIVGAVSAVDTYWSFKNQDILLRYEQNPVGRWLIMLDGGDVALFMTAKMIGTLIVMCAIPLLYRFKAKWGLTVGLSVGTFQLLLFLYLNLGQHIAAI